MKEDTLFRIIAVIVFLGIVFGMVWAGWHLKTSVPPGSQIKVVTYNNFQFVNQQNYWGAKNGQAPIITNFWFTQWQNAGKTYDLQFRFLPNETLDVPMSGQVSESFFNGTLYIAFDPAQSYLQNVTLAAGELSLNLARGLNYDLIAACTSQAPGCEDSPIITCEKNTSLPIIYLSQKSPASISLSGNCVTVSGEGKELIRAVDRLLYVWYGIISTG